MDRIKHRRRWRIAAGMIAVSLGSAAIPASAGTPSHAGTVAITFDDLPIFPEFPSLAQASRTTNRLLDGFRRNHWPVTGFVNESQFDDEEGGGTRAQRIAVLRRWVDAGMDLGNHTYSHASLTITPAPAYIRDIARGDAVTRRLMARHGKAERWFRHPYLETGATPAARRQVETWLAAHHYRVAPVSMENSDWEFAEPYDDALRRGRPAEAQAIRQAYLRYTAAIVPWYKAAARSVLGREPAFIFLLHASRLNAESVDALASLFARAGLKPVTLDRAIADPAYRIPDDYAGKTGIVWVRRWALALHRPLPLQSLPRVPADIAAAYARIEAADPDARTTLPPAKPAR